MLVFSMFASEVDMLRVRWIGWKVLMRGNLEDLANLFSCKVMDLLI